MTPIREDAQIIIQEAIQSVLPKAAVGKALQDYALNEELFLVAIGKAAWKMAQATVEQLGPRIRKGIVITKYHHGEGPIDNCEIYEAGHPVPDENSVKATAKVLEMTSQLSSSDQLILLISGGGSALFEQPLEGVSLGEIAELTDQLLRCGANITEINTIRKHLSAVKGGRFAAKCGGANLLTIVLSDVVGDQLDTIASGPAWPDSTTSREAMDIIKKYKLQVGKNLLEAMLQETPKSLKNCNTKITGNVASLCMAAEESAKKLGYQPYLLSTTIQQEARSTGESLAAIAWKLRQGIIGDSIPLPPCAVIAGGETIVKIVGNGKGGRNQELALAAAIGIEGMNDVVIFSVGSDGTDGPTDAAGGMVDGETASRIRNAAGEPVMFLDNNDSYHALESSHDLIFTGPTGTNVNDLMVILLK